MRIFYFFFLIFTISFSQNKITKSDIIGKWEVKVKVKQLLKQEIKNLDMLEKMAVELASGFAEDIIDSAEMYVLFKKDNTALVNLEDSEDGISPGQACVFYNKDKFGLKVLGGGWIKN